MSVTTAAPVEASAAAASSPVRDGVAALVPLAIAYAPFALVVGTALAAHDGGITGWAGSWLVYGGSAQLAALRLVDTSGAVVAILTGLLINARMAVYTASLGRRWRTQPRWFRLLAASLVIDATWALGNDRPVSTAPDERRFFLTVGLGLGAVWCTVIGIGAAFGGRLDLAAMDVIAPLCLVALVAPHLRRRAGRATVVVAAVVAVIAVPRLPAGTGLLVAAAAGCLAGELAGHGAGGSMVHQ